MKMAGVEKAEEKRRGGGGWSAGQAEEALVRNGGEIRWRTKEAGRERMRRERRE